MAKIKCGKCGSIHASVSDVKACYGSATSTPKPTGAAKATQVPAKASSATATPTSGAGATIKQCGFVAKLGTERDVPAANSGTDPFPYVERYMDCLERHAALLADSDDPKWVTTKEASKVIDWLLALPKVAKAKGAKGGGETPELEDGVYKHGETIYKVYHTVHGQNVQVAKRLVVTEADGKFTAEFVYEGKKPLYSLTPEMHLSEEEAAEFGKVYGFCINCARTLTKEESIHVGYGKICAGHNGWWYPTKAELKEMTAVVIES